MNIAFPPTTTQMLTGGLLSARWVDWFVSMWNRLNRTGDQVGSVALTAQDATISATDVPMAALPAGLYRVSYYARITQAATSSSSLTVTVGWTDGAVACTVSGAAVTGNTTGTTQSGSFVVSVDEDGPLQYATTYSSTGATPMEYSLAVRVEALP